MLSRCDLHTYGLINGSVACVLAKPRAQHAKLGCHLRFRHHGAVQGTVKARTQAKHKLRQTMGMLNWGGHGNQYFLSTHLRLRRHGAVQGMIEARARAEGELGQAMRVWGSHRGGRLRQQLGSAQQRVLAAHAGVLQLVQGQRLLPLKRLQPVVVAILRDTADCCS